MRTDEILRVLDALRVEGAVCGPDGVVVAATPDVRAHGLARVGDAAPVRTLPGAEMSVIVQGASSQQVNVVLFGERPLAVPPLLVRVLGGFQVVRVDVETQQEQVLFSGAKRDKLMELLLLAALGEGVPRAPSGREAVAAALWPDQPSSERRDDNLKKLARRLPQLSERLGLPGGQSPVVYEDRTFRLNGAVADLDVAVLLRARQRTGDLTLAGDRAEAGRLAEQVLLRTLSGREGGVLAEDVQATPWLGPYTWGVPGVTGRLARVAAEQMVAEGRHHQLLELCRLVLRHSPLALEAAIIAVQVGVQIDETSFARSAYETYCAAMQEPESWEAVLAAPGPGSKVY
jgi:hypothetical protein